MERMRNPWLALLAVLATGCMQPPTRTSYGELFAWRLRQPAAPMLCRLALVGVGGARTRARCPVTVQPPGPDTQ